MGKHLRSAHRRTTLAAALLALVIPSKHVRHAGAGAVEANRSSEKVAATTD